MKNGRSPGLSNSMLPSHQEHLDSGFVVILPFLKESAEQIQHRITVAGTAEEL